jgi:hypothetical protein
VSSDERVTFETVTVVALASGVPACFLRLSVNAVPFCSRVTAFDSGVAGLKKFRYASLIVVMVAASEVDRTEAGEDVVVGRVDGVGVLAPTALLLLLLLLLQAEIAERPTRTPAKVSARALRRWPRAVSNSGIEDRSLIRLMLGVEVTSARLSHRSDESDIRVGCHSYRPRAAALKSREHSSLQDSDSVMIGR